LRVKAHRPLDERTAVCDVPTRRGAILSATNFTVPVTTGRPVGRFTSTEKTIGLLAFETTGEATSICVGSRTGIKSTLSGIQVPCARLRKVEGVPLNTFRSTRVPGTPYFFAIPQDVYCHTTQREEQFAVVQGVTKHPAVFNPGCESGSKGLSE
jgi:hypothetical protein